MPPPDQSSIHVAKPKQFSKKLIFCQHACHLVEEERYIIPPVELKCLSEKRRKQMAGLLGVGQC